MLWKVKRNPLPATPSDLNCGCGTVTVTAATALVDGAELVHRHELIVAGVAGQHVGQREPGIGLPRHERAIAIPLIAKRQSADRQCVEHDTLAGDDGAAERGPGNARRNRRSRGVAHQGKADVRRLRQRPARPLRKGER